MDKKHGFFKVSGNCHAIKTLSGAKEWIFIGEVSLFGEARTKIFTKETFPNRRDCETEAGRMADKIIEGLRDHAKRQHDEART